MTERHYQNPGDDQTGALIPPPFSTSGPADGDGRTEQWFLQLAWRLGISVLCLLALGYIAQGNTAWSRWTKAYLHQAVNASTAQTFGKLYRSPALQNIMANSRNLLRMEQINPSGWPEVPSGVVGGPMAEAVWPVRGKLIRHFGWYQPEPGSGRRFTKGIVLAGRAGERVVAVHSGRVNKVELESASGWVVEVEHSGGWHSVYHNLGRVAVRLNQEVDTGGVLGALKSTSRPLDRQLRLELYKAGRLIDPLTVIGPG
jgi:murein DD-endopeptidase MepM/ murein hydrolase activator NlpD